jgi:hypothetical protein
MDIKIVNGCQLVHCGEPRCVEKTIRPIMLARKFAIPAATRKTTLLCIASGPRLYMCLFIVTDYQYL